MAAAAAATFSGSNRLLGQWLEISGATVPCGGAHAGRNLAEGQELAIAGVGERDPAAGGELSAS